jgi:hypothetical protein
MDKKYYENVISIGQLQSCINMLINMHKDLNCNMVNLVEKLGANVPMVEGNMKSTKSLRKSEVQDPKLSTLILAIENISTQVDQGV